MTVTGEILQKASNYRRRVIILGDFMSDTNLIGSLRANGITGRLPA